MHQQNPGSNTSRVASASAIAPLEYAALIWGVLWGWMFWLDWPEPLERTGIAIIADAGVAVLRLGQVKTT